MITGGFRYNGVFQEVRNVKKNKGQLKRKPVRIARARHDIQVFDVIIKIRFIFVSFPMS
jgi:hypothetical protein